MSQKNGQKAKAHYQTLKRPRSAGIVPALGPEPAGHRKPHAGPAYPGHDNHHPWSRL